MHAEKAIDIIHLEVSGGIGGDRGGQKIKDNMKMTSNLMRYHLNLKYCRKVQFMPHRMVYTKI